MFFLKPKNYPEMSGKEDKDYKLETKISHEQMTWDPEEIEFLAHELPSSSPCSSNSSSSTSPVNTNSLITNYSITSNY